jgi:hypothetical protein
LLIVDTPLKLLNARSDTGELAIFSSGELNKDQQEGKEVRVWQLSVISRSSLKDKVNPRRKKHSSLEQAEREIQRSGFSQSLADIVVIRSSTLYSDPRHV